MTKIPEVLTDFAEVIIDSYFIIDLEHNLLEYNRAFRAMLPRTVARRLKTKKCYDVLQLDICEENCIAKQCIKLGRHVRFDEIKGRVPDDEQELRFILSAIPIRGAGGDIKGALVMHRNVTDEALVQEKYQRQMEASANQQRQLERDLQLRTQRLQEVSRRLMEAQKRLFDAKTQLFG
jgi:hypothetical protein